MSSSAAAECWEVSGRKPSFSQTCSRLSRYLKEKGTFGDLTLGMTCKPDVNGEFAVTRQPTMMNLFPCDASADEDIKPKIPFLRQASLSSSSSSGTREETLKKINETKSVKQESGSAALTIFYGGQVLVFDDFPAEKAKQVIDLANKGTAQVNYTQKEIVSNPNQAPSPAKTVVAHETMQTNQSALACELPIARRASLHRFLAKRKDRITSKAPYQVDGSAEASSKPNAAWLGSQ